MGSGGAQGDGQAVDRSIDRDAYLDRIGLEAGAAGAHPEPGALAALVGAHLYTVPFENLDIWRGVELSLEIGALFDKVVSRRRGGFCYELNGLFAVLLEGLGYRVRRYSARVFNTDRGELGPPFDHLALGVSAPGLDEQLVDVGFGEGPRAPMALVAGATLDDVAGRWRLNDAPGGELRLELTGARRRRVDGDGYQLDPTPRSLGEFAAMCRHHQTAETSPFTRGPRCTLATEGGRITVTRTTVIEQAGDERREREHGDIHAELARVGVVL